VYYEIGVFGRATVSEPLLTFRTELPGTDWLAMTFEASTHP
jgi:hypothetical protein